jgi:site-specific recombinase XerD
MTARPTSYFDTLVEEFFGRYLPHQRGLSERTVESYRDAFRLWLEFIQAHERKSAADVELSDFTPETIQAFLNHLESERRNSVHSRNLRLVALRAFMKFAAPLDRSPLRSIERSLAVPLRRFVRPKPQLLSREQMQAIIGVPDGSWIGHRDHMLLTLLYNTAATVSEIIHLRVQDVLLDGADGDWVQLRRGQRTRSVPLWPATAAALRHWLALNPHWSASAMLLPNRRGTAMTATCIRRRLARAVRNAGAHDPGLAQRRISPRGIRHSAAIHLLQRGTDIGLVTHWLGHNTPATMHNHARTYRIVKAPTVLQLPPRGV